MEPLGDPRPPHPRTGPRVAKGGYHCLGLAGPVVHRLYGKAGGGRRLASAAVVRKTLNALSSPVRGDLTTGSAPDLFGVAFGEGAIQAGTERAGDLFL